MGILGYRFSKLTSGLPQGDLVERSFNVWPSNCPAVARTMPCAALTTITWNHAALSSLRRRGAGAAGPKTQKGRIHGFAYGKAAAHAATSSPAHRGLVLHEPGGLSLLLQGSASTRRGPRLRAGALRPWPSG